jgi:CheY-like chemotaxis protein
MMMPEMDGFALLAALRKDPATQTIPVILLSARAGEEARIEGIGAGADDYLTKPFSARELVARVEAQLKMARLRRDAIEQEAALNQEMNRTRQFAWEALEHIPEVFYIFDKEFRFTYMNAAGAEIEAKLGKPMLGEVFWDLFPELLGTSWNPAFAGRWKSGSRWNSNTITSRWKHGSSIVCIRCPMRASSCTRRTRPRAQGGAGAAEIGTTGRGGAVGGEHCTRDQQSAGSGDEPAVPGQDGPGDAEQFEGAAGDGRQGTQRLSHIAARSLKFYRQRTAPTLTSMEELLESVIFFHETTIKSRSIDLNRRYRKAPQVFCFPR